MKSSVFFKTTLGSLLLLAGLHGAAAATGDEAVRDTIAKMIPGVEVDEIEAIPVSKLYQVVIGTEVVYVSEDGKYMVSGDLIDVEGKVNLTEDRRAISRKKIVEGLDEKGMIVFEGKGNKHTVTVFTDIDCPYCRKMHQEMDQYNAKGITIRYLAFPRAGVGSRSYDKAVAAWCAKDSKQALTNAKAGNETKLEQKADCGTPVDDHLALVRKLGLTGTPALILDDGSLIPGYVPAARLSVMLDGVGPATME